LTADADDSSVRAHVEGAPVTKIRPKDGREGETDQGPEREAAAPRARGQGAAQAGGRFSGGKAKEGAAAGR